MCGMFLVSLSTFIHLLNLICWNYYKVEKKATGICFLQGIHKDNVYRKKNMLTMSNPNSFLNFSVSLEECGRQKLSLYTRTKSNYWKNYFNEKS